MNIAMWSGPRNLSTAMMYSFGNRADCDVVDEPFYAAYLSRTGANHPMRDEILTSQSTDPNVVARNLVGSNKGEKRHTYQKHMCQHMIEGIPRDWMADVVNVFLIRHPARVLASFSAKFENPTIADLGFHKQEELYAYSVSLGQSPIVVDAADIRERPKEMLQLLCKAIDLAFDEKMLRWPQGGHIGDGIWARHWYGSVHQSTGFAGRENPLPNLDGDYRKMSEQCLASYEKLHALRLR